MKNHLKAFLSLAIILVSGNISSNAQTYEPLADPSAVVTCGNARFTVLTPRLVRMEWAADGQFEDRATLAVVNRRLEVPQFRTQKKKDGVTIRTSDLTLTYKGNGDFTQENLKVEFTMADPKAPKGVRKVVWTPGADDSGNLLGTTRTLDGCDGVKTKEPYDKGILSRDGWAVLDESSRPVLREDDSDWKTWVEERNDTQRSDLYIFAYGHDYKQALADFTKVAGKIPLPPKYAFGYWWSRYWQYSDYEFINLAKMIRSMGVPMDVMVVDMDWHETWGLRRKNPVKDEFGQRIGWTGYTWQKELFPSPENFLQELHNLGLKTSLNLHPASGIQPYEECYDRFVKDYTSRTSVYDGPEGFVKEDGAKAPVPFRISEREWTDAYFNSVIHPLENQGVDFWWLDWQQWKYSKYMPTLNNTFWLNRTFFDDKVRRGESEGKDAERPMIYHRWGGIGSHRYQIGFSGDTFDTWTVLGYLPYFTATASNVGYGYWGHDIGGHQQKKDGPTNPEIYTRWLQYGVFTPIFKTHSTKSASLERRIWMFPDHFETLREAVRLRYSLSPYIYNAARQTYDTGVSICRPMYYDYPEEDLAYTMSQEFMFGDDILATVIDTPADTVTTLSPRGMWFPQGNDWYDMATGRMVSGGSCDTLYYTIKENPYYVKAGSVIPLASDNIMNLQGADDELCLLVIPGEGRSELSLYADDGSTQAYTTDYSITKVVKQTEGNVIRMTVAPAEGSYKGMPQERRLRIAFEGVLPPVGIKVNGREIPYSRFAKEGEWSYDGMNLTANLLLEAAPVSGEISIECILPQENTRELLDGKKGLIKRFAAVTPDVKYMYNTQVDRYAMLPDEYLRVAQCGSFLTEHPEQAASHLKAMDLDAMISALAATGKVPEAFLARLQALSHFSLK